MKNPRTEKSEETHLTLDEVHKTMATISRADVIRLNKLESWFARNNPTCTLLVDAIDKTMDGTRSWKRGMPLCEHLYGIMRSLANNEHKKKTVNKTVLDYAPSTAAEDAKTLLKISPPSPEDILLEEQEEKIIEAELNKFFDLFSKDENAALILMGDMDGMTPEEIRAVNGMSKTAYDSARKSIRRKLEKLYPQKNRN